MRHAMTTEQVHKDWDSAHRAGFFGRRILVGDAIQSL
jgi:hypothetical protein